MASAAGDRAKLGTGPPCKSFEDLVTFADMRKLREDFLGCINKDDIVELQQKFKPIKKAVQELIALCTGVGKDLKGAVTAATKRAQQAAEQDSKRRKITPASQQPAAAAITIFEYLPGYSGALNEKVKQVTIGKLAEANDLGAPFLINIAQDMPDWPPVLSDVQKVADDFRVEFEASPLRSSMGRAQKAFSKLSPNPNLESDIRRVLFSKIVPPQKLAALPSASDALKAALTVQCVGSAKNSTSCIPELGHLCTVIFAVKGSSSFIAMPLVPVLSFFAGQEGKPELPLNEALQLLKHMPADSLPKFLEDLANDQVIYHGTCGANDTLFLPPSWIMIQSTGSEDMLGIKLRFVISSHKDNLCTLATKLGEHKCPSNLVNEVVQYLSGAAQAAGGQ